MHSIEEYLDECYREEFARVVATWNLRHVRKQVAGAYGCYEGEGQMAVLRLLNEHGCISCEIRPCGEEDFIGVPVFMRLVDHIGKKVSPLIPERRRYSLREQCDMLVERKEDIVRTLSPSLADERRAILMRFNAAYTAQFKNRI